jgi:hypothetical protein
MTSSFMGQLPRLYGLGGPSPPGQTTAGRSLCGRCMSDVGSEHHNISHGIISHLSWDANSCRTRQVLADKRENLPATVITGLLSSSRVILLP